MPGIAIDTGIVGFQTTVKILLLEPQHGFCLPGGFVRRNEALNDEALRVLE